MDARSTPPSSILMLQLTTDITANTGEVSSALLQARGESSHQPGQQHQQQRRQRSRGQVVALAKATPKVIYYRDETAQKLIKGINAVADVVKVRAVRFR